MFSWCEDCGVVMIRWCYVLGIISQCRCSIYDNIALACGGRSQTVSSGVVHQYFMLQIYFF